MLDQFDSCEKENIVHQLVKVQAQVKVTPIVKHGTPKAYCVDSGIRPHSGHENCEGECSDCEFTLTQLICVEVPISFDVDVDIKKGILCCSEPDIMPDRKYEVKDDIDKQVFALLNNKIRF